MKEMTVEAALPGSNGRQKVAARAEGRGKYMKTTWSKKVAAVPNTFFVALVCLQFLPNRRTDESVLLYLLLLGLLEASYLVYAFLSKENERVQTVGDLLSLVFVSLGTWQLLTVKIDVLDRMLFPSPAIVLGLFLWEAPTALKGAAGSLEILLVGYGCALLTAIPLGLVSGWVGRLTRTATPITRVLGPVPPTVYIPYAIVMLPTFKLSSMFVIFIGAFWPVFINTLNGVHAIEGRLIDSARVLKLGPRTMITKVIFPGTLPSIITGATIGLAMSFILLTAAEMIGATSGLGWWVKYFSDFADYPRVIVGILYTGVVVTAIMFGFDKAEKRLLRWRR
jgi:NitT/TauT family transport system permease protein